ncbi:hypothetical protein [Paenibacillus daejeonensis]|uniref:hypothetical protein n=1 Tax=Paenibacillus daejeonensis TaxID=135193 RepID=UPI00037A3CFE|nr:hypothetical protein [Paenibacillus daejeonensis]
MKGLRHLDYAVYGDKLLVPMILLTSDGWDQLIDDELAGRCRLVEKPRKRK